MTLEKILEFIDAQDIFLEENYGKRNTTLKERIFARCIKLNEEVGELNEQILGYYKDQRSSKLHKYSMESLEDEYADILICTLLLAKITNIDIKKLYLKNSKKFLIDIIYKEGNVV